METALGNADILRHGTIHPITEAAARRVQVVEAGARQRREFIDHRRGLANYAIAFFEVFHGRAGRCDSAAKLVPQDTGIIHRPTVRTAPLVQVAAADADRSHS